MQEIDPSNIVSRRTRGRKIDFAKEAEAAGDELEDDDEEDEEYVHPPAVLSLSRRHSAFVLCFRSSLSWAILT
jgi:Histone chaperone domain CHZ